MDGPPELSLCEQEAQSCRTELSGKKRGAGSTKGLSLCSCPSPINVRGVADRKKISSAPWISAMRLRAEGMN